MENKNSMELLFQYAFDYRFRDFDSLFCELEAEMTPEAFFEAYLLRAQIKLYTTDLSILDDLAKAEQGNGTPQFPLLITSWKSDGTNHFIVFPKAPGAVQAFLEALPLVHTKLSRWYGTQSDVILLQLQGEIRYFMGDIEAALPFVGAPRDMENIRPIDVMLALILEYRCCLALAQTAKAHEHMFAIIRQSRSYPECVNIYEQFRGWANMTTGCAGDSPRLYKDEDGRTQPFLQDRLNGMQVGLWKNTIQELPFIEYGAHSYTGACSLRQYYINLFHAMYWCSVNDHKQAEAYFHKVYEIAVDSGIFMPIYECGVQSMPLLTYLKNKGAELPLDNLMQRSTEYEAGVNAYRLSDI